MKKTRSIFTANANDKHICSQSLQERGTKPARISQI